MRPNVDSPTMPGKRHVVSGPLSEYGDRNAIFDQLLGIARDPAMDAKQKYVRRNVEVVEREPSCFEVKVQKCGRKLRSLKLQENSQDPPEEALICRYNRDRGTIAVETEAMHSFPKCIQCFLFLNDPLRLEFWTEIDGQHHGDEKSAWFLQFFWLNSVAERMAKVPVSVQDDVDSPAGGGLKSAMSGSLDTFFTYDKLVEGLIEELRVPPEGFFVVTSRDLPQDGFEQVVNNSEAQLAIVYKFDHDKGTALVQTKHGGYVLLNTSYAIHRDPLRLECWMEYESGRVRLGSRCAGNELQELVNRLLGRVQRTCLLL
uniref:Uncharacterized protein n=1 Tax=Alexandrium catenella TaxID=2925 RepID=A0A7S1L563_ALECA